MPVIAMAFDSTKIATDPRNERNTSETRQFSVAPCVALMEHNKTWRLDDVEDKTNEHRLKLT